jgi:hypothetical protein
VFPAVQAGQGAGLTLSSAQLKAVTSLSLLNASKLAYGGFMAIAVIALFNAFILGALLTDQTTTQWVVALHHMHTNSQVSYTQLKDICGLGGGGGGWYKQFGRCWT